MKEKLLIVVDMQNDFIDGPLGTKEAVVIVPKVKKKIEEYRSRGNGVVFTKDTHHINYLDTLEGKHLPIEHCIGGTHGWQIPSELHATGRFTIHKNKFGTLDWQRLLDVYTDVELVGLCTDICVISNALIIKSLDYDINVTVDASCCAGTTPENHKAALQVMKSCHVNVIGGD